MAKPPGKCIFCGSGGLTKEHIWSEWTYKLVPKDPINSRTIHKVKTSRATKIVEQSANVVQGTSNSMRVRAVCSGCNSGWMSSLDNQAIPLLTPLIARQEFRLDSTESLRLIATWVSMKLMVAEFIERATVSTTEYERDWLRHKLEPPLNWHVWACDIQPGTKWETGYYRESAGLFLLPEEPGAPLPPTGIKNPNTQSVTIGIGRLLFHVIASTAPGYVISDRYPMGGNTIAKIWPPKGVVIWPPRVTLTNEGADHISVSLSRFIASKITVFVPDTSF